MSSPGPNRRGAAAATGWYFASNLLLSLAGLISLPVMTRLLDKEDYGLLNLALASIALFTLFGRLGFAQSITRFYAEHETNGAAALRLFCETILGGAFVSSAAAATIAVLASGWLAGPEQTAYAAALRWGALLIVIRVLASVIFQIFRAQERVFAYALAQLVARYGTLAFVLLLLLTGHRTALAVLLATITCEALLVVICALELAARGIMRRPHISWPIVRTATSYGVPLAVAGSASFLLDYGDRFLIERFLGLRQVAMYVVPYDLAQQLATAIFSPARLATVPIIFRLWAQDGQAATAAFVSRVFTYLVAVSVPVAALMLVLGDQIIVLLASEKYSGASHLLPYLLPGVFLGEINFLIASGLTIQKDTVALAVIVLAGGVLNVILNLILLPRWGLSAAAIATTVSYVFLTLLTYWRTRSVLALRLDINRIARSLLATAAMVAGLIYLGPVSVSTLVDVVTRGIVGVSIAGGCLLLLDRELRQTCMKLA